MSEIGNNSPGTLIYSQEIGSIDPDAPPPYRKWSLHVIAGLGILILIAVCSFLWIRFSENFPSLAPGAYAGSIQLFADGGQPLTYRWYVEQPEDAEGKLFVALLEPGWSPELIPPPVRRAGDPPQPLSALVLRGAEVELRMVGSVKGTEGYAGTVTEEKSGTQGSWNLKPVRPVTAAPIEGTELTLWLSLSEELATVEAQIQESDKLVPQQREEIEKLTAFIAERGELKTRADQKLKEITDEVSVAREKLQARRKESRRLEQRIDLALKVTPMGRLVALSRESLEREGRWLQSVRGDRGAEGSAELLAAVQRAEQVLVARRTIRELRSKLANVPVVEGEDVPQAADNQDL
jgi:hypothetical protein